MNENNEFIAQINRAGLPAHIAIIMDGNGRWASQRGKGRILGHRNAVQSVREVVTSCAELKIPYLSLYAFSTENWKRPKSEVNGLMSLLVSTIEKELSTLLKNNIRFSYIGNIAKLPKKTQNALLRAKEATQLNDGMGLILALNYSGRWDIINAVNLAIDQAKQGKDVPFEQYLSTAGIPDPELLIRTSGELRISNFYLWQAAYTELYFTNILWPDFKKKHLLMAILDYQKRDRRFGKIQQPSLIKKNSEISI